MPSDSIEEIRGDPLGALVRSLWFRVDRGSHVTRRRGESVRPPATRGVEHKILLRARINRRGIAANPIAAVPGFTGRDHLQAGQRSGIPLPFPTDQTGNAVALFHFRSFKEPVIGHAADPIAAAHDWRDAPRSHECIGIWTFV